MSAHPDTGSSTTCRRRPRRPRGARRQPELPQPVQHPEAGETGPTTTTSTAPQRPCSEYSVSWSTSGCFPDSRAMRGPAPVCWDGDAWESKWRWSTAPASHLRPSGGGVPARHPAASGAIHLRNLIEAYRSRVEPADRFINWQQDAFGNFVARLIVPNRARRLSITVGLIADLKVINPFDFFIEEYAEAISVRIPKALLDDLEAPTCVRSTGREGSGPGPLVGEWVRNFAVIPAPGPSTSGVAQPGGERRRGYSSGWNPASRPRTSRCAPGRILP